MPSPARADIDTPLWRGDTICIPFELKLGEDPINLEGATVKFTLKLDPYAPDEAADFTYEQAVPVGDADGAQGRHVVQIGRDDLELLELTRHTYQFMVIFPNSTEITYVWGKISVKDS